MTDSGITVPLIRIRTTTSSYGGVDGTHFQEDLQSSYSPVSRWKKDQTEILTITLLLALCTIFGTMNRVSFRPLHFPSWFRLLSGFLNHSVSHLPFHRTSLFIGQLMQYSMVNYLFPLLVITVTFSVAINFFVVLVKLIFTNDITPEMHQFPKWKFFVMGSLDGLSLLFLLVGGANVSGIKQLILLQAAVPVTMIFSLLLLRYKGNHICRLAREILDRNGANYTELYLGEDVIAKADGSPMCRLLINGRDIGNIPRRLERFKPMEEDIIEVFFKYIKRKFYKNFGSIFRTNQKYFSDSQKHVRNSGHSSDVVEMFSLEDDINSKVRLQSIDKNEALKILLKHVDVSEISGEVLLFTDGHSWRKHFQRFFSPVQYVGASVILIGVLLTVLPQLRNFEDLSDLGSSWALIYLFFTIPAALSSLYKEIVFRSINMDVWYLSAFTSLSQLLMTFMYILWGSTELVDLHLDKIPEHFKNSVQCLFGENIISRADGYDCLVDPVCGYDIYHTCCDSCDGTINSAQAVSSGYIVLFQSFTNVIYNLILVLVIKHGSATLMYVATALVLPLGSVIFNSEVIMGVHATPFTMYTISGLSVVLFGIIVYRGVDWCWRQNQSEKWRKKEGGSYYGIPGFS